MENLGILTIPHPPNSPDLAPSDFFLFGYIKDQLRGVYIPEDPKELQRHVENIMKSIGKKKLRKVFKEWIRRCEKCVEVKGDFFEYSESKK